MNIAEPHAYYVYVPMLILSVAASLMLAAAAWRRRPAPGAKSLAAMMVAGAFWGAAYALELSFSEPAIRALWGELKYLGIVIVPFMWLTFALCYTGRDGWLVTHRRKKLALLAAIPLATAVMALTNGMHHLLRSYEDNPAGGMPLEVIHGPWFWVHASYSYLLLLVGTFLLLSTLFWRSRPYRGQWVAVAIGSLVPCAVNVVYVSDVEVLRGLDPTPFAFTLAGGVLFWECLRFGLLDLIPVAREAVVEEMSDGLIVTDSYGRVIDTNRVAQSFLGFSGPAAFGRKLGDLLPALPISSIQRTFCQGGREHSPERHLSREYPQDERSPIVQEIHLGEGQAQSYYELEFSPLESGGGVPVEGVVIVLREITERKRAETALAESQKQLYHQALHDPLTGLPNRYLLESRLKEAPCHSRTAPTSDYRDEVSLDKTYVAILFMDLDGFKEVNDSLGHSAGDGLLRSVAERLESGVRAQDTAARFGGDEFCVLLGGVSGTTEAVRITQRLRDSLRMPFVIGTSTVRISASIGVAVGRPDIEDSSLDELVREADAAMYRAKKKGGALYEVVELDEDPAR